jgi:DNA polymerase III epsilon subunit-like protein
MSLFTEKPNRRRIMVFDVETTGLLPKKHDSVALTELPHILQISFVIFDTQYWKVVKSVDRYINVAPDVEISEKITEITGITRSICDTGTSITNALHEFYTEYMLCNMIVAHNIQFDRDMILTELRRHKDELIGRGCYSVSSVFDTEYEKTVQKDIFCTMRVGRNACKIERTALDGKIYYKSPKLVELYEHLFRETPLDLHNSLVDTYICLRCLVKLRFKFDLSLEMFPNIRFKPLVEAPATSISNILEIQA